MSDTGNEWKDKKKTNIVWFLCIVIWPICVLCSVTSDYGLDWDVVWHIVLGKEIIENKKIVLENMYTWIPGTYWSQQEWLYDILLYTIVSIFGTYGYYLISAIAKAILFVLACRYSEKKGVSFILFSVFFTLIMRGFPHNAMNRPAEYSTFLFIFLTNEYIKRIDIEEIRWIQLIKYFAVGVLVGNFHAGISFVCIALMAIQILLELIFDVTVEHHKVEPKYYIYKATVPLAFLCGVCINPCGFYQIPNMIRGSQMETTRFLGEWKAWAPSGYIRIIALLLIVVSLGFSLREVIEKRQKKDFVVIGTLLATLTLGMYSKKAVIVFTYIYIVFGYPYLQNMCKWIVAKMEIQIDNIKLSAAYIVVSGIFILTVTSAVFHDKYNSIDDFINEEMYNRFSITLSMLDHMKKNNGERRLHSYWAGNLLMWKGIKIFVDTRQHPYAKENANVMIAPEVKNANVCTVDDVILMSFTKDREIMDELFDQYDFTEVLSTTEGLDIEWYMDTRKDFVIFDEDEHIDDADSQKVVRACLYVKKGTH